MARSGQYADLLGKPAPFVLAPATPGALGGVIPDGTSIAVDASGRISAVAGAHDFTFAQGPASDTWVVKHLLGRFPAVTVVDSAGNVVEGGVRYDSADQITLSFSAPFSGSAYLT